jgi:hypothetical protein
MWTCERCDNDNSDDQDACALCDSRRDGHAPSGSMTTSSSGGSSGFEAPRPSIYQTEPHLAHGDPEKAMKVVFGLTVLGCILYGLRKWFLDGEGLDGLEYVVFSPLWGGAFAGVLWAVVHLGRLLFHPVRARMGNKRPAPLPEREALRRTDGSVLFEEDEDSSDDLLARLAEYQSVPAPEVPNPEAVLESPSEERPLPRVIETSVVEQQPET